MLHIAKEYDKILATGCHIIIILQSDSEKLSKQISETELPFKIICDLEQILYKKFDT